MSERVTVGLISDTHGLLRPEALDTLRGSDHIVHAGDIGGAALLAELARIAPVTAIRGNVDKGTWAAALPETEMLEIGGVRIYIIHNIAELDLDPAAAGLRVVVHGHSHRPGVHEKDGVMFVNPGSAGPRRFSLPISVGRLVVGNGRVSAELVEITLAGR
jgi:putative phosphoesterase